MSSDGLRRLVKARNRDVEDDFNEQMNDLQKSNRRVRTLSDSDDDDAVPSKMARKDDDFSSEAKQSKVGGIGAKLLQKMGYKEGEALGKNKQGRLEPVALTSARGRHGIGHSAAEALSRDVNVVWDDTTEKKTVEEAPVWMEPASDDVRSEIADKLSADMKSWIVIGKEKLSLDNEDRYCEGRLLEELLKAKSVFDELSTKDLNEARQRANPYETIGSAFFQNRAAMKTANLDRIFDWILSGEDSDGRELKNPIEPKAKQQNVDRNAPLFYFADVCAGPGGFSEYMLWRKGFYNAKGFGFTLKGKDDFKLFRFQAGTPEFFEPYYGVDNDGNVMSPQNITALADVVKRGTGGQGGVDLMMADGGFSVEGQENIQEILSKRLYLCQFLVSLSIVRPETEDRPGGNFVCKLFDIFTPFSIGLIYLMYIAYRKISLHKCHTSRPANSERYIMCEGLTQEGATVIREYFTAINNKLNDLEKGKKKGPADDVMEIVPEEVIKDDPYFMDYILDHNNSLARRQIQYLNKYRVFVKNQGQIDMDQADLREKCLEYWRIPDLPKKRVNDRNRDSPDVAFGKLCEQLLRWDHLGGTPRGFDDAVLKSTDSFAHVAKYHYCAYTERTPPSIFVTLTDGSTFYRGLDERNWNRYDMKIRVPRNSLFLAQTTFRYKLKNGQLYQAKRVLRIVDAANLAGDNVTKLSYPERMKAAKKYCAAAKLYGGSAEWTGELVAADTYSLEDLVALDFDLKVFQNQPTALLVDPDCPEGSLLQVHSFRVVNILKENFDFCWSRSKRLIYISERQGRMPTVFLNSVPSDHASFASFWDTLLTRKSGTSQGESPPKQMIWRWTPKIQSSSQYGAKTILRENSSTEGPTLESLRDFLDSEYERLSCNGARLIGDVFRQ
uniref:Cap-specific mRNA (nucleoside-2'-O-)-methyltransferase 1 n=1 Tax=Steinernema glaseri TaxID=37863 RepID=A0A1I7ZIG7_9BILA